MKTTLEVTELHTLILRIAKGDETSFEILYDQMNEQVSKHIASKFRRQLRPRDVEDIMQYTFLQVWRKAGSYRGKHTNNSAKSWIYTIARNRASKVSKSMGTMPISIESDYSYRPTDHKDSPSVHERKFSSSDNTENEAFDKLMSSRVIEMCKKLPQRDRDMLIMRFEERRTFKEIGKNHNLSSPRIKQIIDGILEVIFYALK
jgi:RNA polymerase sigma factor (sigma-70 family)